MIVLCVHHVGPRYGGNRRYRQFLITPDGLRRVIRSARAAGLEFVSLADGLGGPSAAGHNQVVLTFDDGYENFLTHALPVLETERCPATLFVVAGKLGGMNDWDTDLPPSRLLTLEQLREITRVPGITVGSHGLNHRRLTTLAVGEVERELAESHALLSQQLGDAYLPALAYPYGDRSPEVLASAQRSPYRAAFTIERGHWLPATNPWEIPRHCVGWADGYPLYFWLKALRHRRGRV